ncbi:YdeI/OmpD-associated family protein [Streptomyces sp. WI04-05B]|uniref:YdeI/OmpD-associated family protein n=1 Tax=Streptomyces TaxID=1883 RepID=UPI0029A7E717|nr:MULTISPECIES: YdeI/OmpD-associated family protein [unclassified Streptomyces]MDX2541865.1 YdeI/OmpD-associated family protein [Streptomyces sp. WI04-05B]MDX2586947.1 YdeI/OmpD-associated family protein [Streptomyces sp. WI04-05A]
MRPNLVDTTTQPENTLDGVPVEPFADASALDGWLTAHPAPQHSALWVKVAKKGSGLSSVTAAEVNDVALCHGWITGHRKGLDASHYLQKITPRRPGSQWSMVNVRRVPELAAAGLMRPGGFAEVDAAKADGRWAAAYESQRNASVPDDLVAALERDPRARAAFEALGRTDRYQVVLPLLKARTPDSRAARLAAAVAGLVDGATGPGDTSARPVEERLS